MAEIYFTIAGMNHHHGQDFLEPKMKVKLVKEPDNEYDKEAIKVEMPGIGHIGYVANSPYTVVGESYSAGRLYDKIGDTAKGTVVELAKALHPTPNYLLLGDVEADDWMDDMIQMLEKIKRPEHRELAKKQIALMLDIL